MANRKEEMLVFLYHGFHHLSILLRCAHRNSQAALATFHSVAIAHNDAPTHKARIERIGIRHLDQRKFASEG